MFDISRGNDADKNTPRNINVSFTNNTAVPISALIFITYFDEFVIDVDTGIIQSK